MTIILRHRWITTNFGGAIPLCMELAAIKLWLPIKINYESRMTDTDNLWDRKNINPPRWPIFENLSAELLGWLSRVQWP